jgi:glucose-6-phosphate isomerase
MGSGERINATEARAVMHIALRAPREKVTLHTEYISLLLCYISAGALCGFGERCTSCT